MDHHVASTKSSTPSCRVKSKAVKRVWFTFDDFCNIHQQSPYVTLLIEQSYLAIPFNNRIHKATSVRKTLPSGNPSGKSSLFGIQWHGVQQILLNFGGSAMISPSHSSVLSLPVVGSVSDRADKRDLHWMTFGRSRNFSHLHQTSWFLPAYVLHQML